jgi:hypothetical protein
MKTERIEYIDIPGFESVYLEDSFVLSIEARPGTLEFVLDLVLTPEHPSYREPGPDEQNCYQKSRISFTGVQSLAWARQVEQPAIDVSGEQDYGAIDVLWREGHGSHLEGEWGVIDVQSEAPVITAVIDE